MVRSRAATRVIPLSIRSFIAARCPRDVLQRGCSANMRQGLTGDLPGLVRPQVSDVVVLNTSTTGIHLKAQVNVTNSSPYAAHVPLLNFRVLSNSHVIGDVIIQNMEMTPGRATNTAVRSTWDPMGFGGTAGAQAGRKLLSEYLSGENTTVTVQLHRGSIPGMPKLGQALSRINMTFDTPRLRLPGNDGHETDDGLGFIREAVFHIVSSSATCFLASPLRHNTVHVERIDATAYYNHTEAIGQLTYDKEFEALPGLSKTPHLPVKWDMDSVGYGKLQEALGGSLRLDTAANVTVRLGNWVEEVHYKGFGIGAKVRL